MKHQLILVADNVRSIENTGALFRLADGVGADELILVGITPYPDLGDADLRRPWLRHKVSERLKKTGLSGMGTTFRYFAKQSDAIDYLSNKGAFILAVEQTEHSRDYREIPGLFTATEPRDIVAMIIGHETEGVSGEFIDRADACVEIPMYGKGKSLNVAVAAGVVSYYLRGFLDNLKL